MLFFGVTSALICAAACALALWLYQRALKRAGEDRAKASYLRFVGDVEARVARGDLTPDMAREERTEAARALLRSEAGLAPPEPINPKILVALGLIIAVASLGIYAFEGQPGTPDEPYAERLKRWDDLSKTNPEALSPQALAVVLRQYQDKKADDPLYWSHMGEADMMAENFYQATQDYEALTRLVANSPDAWTQLGMASLFEAEGKPTPRAKAALDEALKLDPKHFGARYFRAGMAVTEGDFGLAHQLLDGLEAGLVGEQREAVTAAQTALMTAEASDRDAKAQVAGMVAGLAQTLKANPENPDGWARLLRSYRVLGNQTAATETEASIRKIYASRPAEAADILRRANRPVGEQRGR